MLIAILNNGRFWFGVKIKLGAKSLASYNLAYNLAVIRSKDNKKGTTVNILHLFWKFVIHSALLSNQKSFVNPKIVWITLVATMIAKSVWEGWVGFSPRKDLIFLWHRCHECVVAGPLSTYKSRIENLPHQSHFLLWALRNYVIWCYVKERSIQRVVTN